MDPMTANPRKESRDAFGRGFVPDTLIILCGIAFNFIVKGSVLVPIASLALTATGVGAGILFGRRKQEGVLAEARRH